MVSGKAIAAVGVMVTFTIGILALYNQAWTARPIIDYSINSYPNTWLTWQGNMTFNLEVQNRGMDDAFSLLTIKTVNARIVIPAPGSNDTLLKEVLLFPKSMVAPTSIGITITPVSNARNFTVTLSLMNGSTSVTDVPNAIASYNQLSITSLTYNMTNSNSYTLVK